MRNLFNPLTPIGAPQFGFNEPEPPEFEFDVISFVAPHNIAQITDEDIKNLNDRLRGFLNDGWQIIEKIVCPPLVTIIFSRLKETKPDGKE